MERTERSIFLNNGNINHFIKNAINTGCVGIDTEFDRTYSYFPRLSLVQFSIGTKVTYIYDFLDKTIDPDQIISLMRDDRILKIIHSCRQDVEAIHYALGIAINPLIDTQIMAEELLFGKQLSYAYLVKKFFGIMLEKELTRSNWMHRPLGDAEVVYASIDAYYLIDLQGQMKTMMSQEQFDNSFIRSKKAAEHSVAQKNPIELWHSYKRFLSSNHYNFEDEEYIIKALFLFREYIARKRNVLPHLIMDDIKMATLCTIKELEPKIVKDMLKLPPYISPEGIIALIQKMRLKNNPQGDLEHNNLNYIKEIKKNVIKKKS